MRVCFGIFHYDAVDAGLQPEQYLSRRLPLRHLPQELASRGHDVMAVHQLPSHGSLVENQVEYRLVRSPRWRRAITALSTAALRRQPARLEAATSAARPPGVPPSPARHCRPGCGRLAVANRITIAGPG